MAQIPAGYADVSVEIRGATMARHSFVTFGVACPALDPNVIAKAVSDSLTATGSFLAGLSNSAYLFGVNVRVGHEIGDPDVGFHGTNVQGQMGQVPPPPNVAVLVSKRTSSGGRRGRGRMFLPWYVSEDAVDAFGNINGVFQGYITTQMLQMLTKLEENDVPMVLLHETYAPPFALPTPVTSLQVDSLVSTQRRRLGR